VNASVERAQFVWQPLTPRGVAAFANASVGRVLLVQFIVALVAAGTVVWFLHKAWFPIVAEAISQLPPLGELESGQLGWHEDSPASLAEGRYLAFAVDLDHTGAARSPAHVQVEFGRTDVIVISLLGCLQGTYPRSWTLAFSRTELGPRWGAWAPAILAITGALVVAGLMLSWAVLASAYCLPVWLIGFFANRVLSLSGSWRLAGAALMPGALILGAAIFLYGWGALDLVKLAVAGAVHLFVGWVYLGVSPLCLPRLPTMMLKENPFA
jgi:hypothetical protein